MSQSNNSVNTINSIEQHEIKIKDITQQAIEYAKKLGATDVEVNGGYSKGFNINVHMGSVETVEYDSGKDLSITVFIGKKRGSASTNDFSESAIKNSVQAAYDFAHYAAEDKFLSLPEKSELVTAQTQKSCELYHPWDISPAQAIELALACEDKLLSIDNKITKTDGASVSTHNSCNVIANSQGLCASYLASSHEIACMPIANQGEEMERDYDYSASRDPSLLWDINKIATSAAKKAIERLGARTLKTFKAPVLFVDYPAVSLIGCLPGAASGSSIYKKSSFLLNKLNQQILPSHINIIESPHIKKAAGSSPFDAEGVLTREKYLIQDGCLATYLYSTYSANQLNTKTTGNCGGVHNLIVSSTQSQSLESIIKSMSKGVIVTSLMGQGVNLVTGDYSRGISGFYVENGEIQFPIHEMTVAGNLNQMFESIIAVGNEVDIRGNIQTGALLIDGMTIAGN